MTPSRQPIRMLALLLFLWLTPQCLLAGHMHLASDKVFADCDICAQLSGTTAAVNGVELVLPPAPSGALPKTIAPPDISRAPASIACRGPPIFLH